MVRGLKRFFFKMIIFHDLASRSEGMTRRKGD